jgi:predicted acetyltransferase
MYEFSRIDDIERVVPLVRFAHSIRHAERDAIVPWLHEAVADGRTLYGVFEDEEVVAACLLYDFRMRLRASVAPMGGLGLVGSRPDHRGRGAVRLLLRELLPVMRERWQVVSTLDPFDQGFYRKYGWEVLSSQRVVSLPPGRIVSLPEGGSRQRVIAKDLSFPDAECMEYYNRFAAAHYTLVQRGEAEWRARTTIRPWHLDDVARGVVKFTKGGTVLGLLGYRMLRPAEGWEPTFEVNLLIADTGEIRHEMLDYVRRLSHQVSVARFLLPMDLEIWPYLVDRPTKEEIRDVFMARVVSMDAIDGLRIDAPDVVLRVQIDDHLADWNHGIWEVAVRDGSAAVCRGETATVRCGVGTFTCVLSGRTTLRHAIDAGLADALPGYNGEDLPRATPAMFDYF